MDEGAATAARKPAWFTEDDHLRISSRTRSKSASDSTADSSALALIVKADNSPADARPPPKHHAAAMLEDAVGWTQAEQDEMANHKQQLLHAADAKRLRKGRSRAPPNPPNLGLREEAERPPQGAPVCSGVRTEANRGLRPDVFGHATSLVSAHTLRHRRTTQSPLAPLGLHLRLPTGATTG